MADETDLTHREIEIVRLIAHGEAAKQIAYRLGISARTVETHRGRAVRKMGARNVADLVRMACEQGWIREGNGTA